MHILLLSLFFASTVSSYDIYKVFSGDLERVQNCARVIYNERNLNNTNVGLTHIINENKALNSLRNLITDVHILRLNVNIFNNNFLYDFMPLVKIYRQKTRETNLKCQKYYREV